MMRTITLLISMVFIGCATVSSLKPSANDFSKMKEKVPGLTLEEAQQGFKIYKYNCSGCHYLPKPGDYTISRWEKILPEMLNRAKINSENDQQLIKKYLFSKSK